MVFSDFHFYSEVLGIQTAAYILLPQPQVAAQSSSPIPVLYLLHGLSDDHTMWLRQTRVEQYAQRYRLAVVMPAANRSFYMDMAHGAKYETFVSRGPFMLRELDDVYGSEHDLLRGPGSLFGLADRFLKEPDRAPRMYMACGTEDFLFDANEHFFARFGKELPIEYHTEPGNHTWDFWDRYIERILAWLPLDQAEGV